MNAFPLHMREETFVRKFNKFPEFLEKFDQFANFEVLQFFLIAISWKFIINFQIIRELKKITDPLFISVIPSFQKTDKQDFQSHSLSAFWKKKVIRKASRKNCKSSFLNFFFLAKCFSPKVYKKIVAVSIGEHFINKKVCISTNSKIS